MLALSLLALAGLASAATDPRYQYTACKGDQLQRCQAKFNDDLQIDPTLGVAQFRQLSQSIQAVWGSLGAVGMRQSCAAFKNYKSCFDTDQAYMNCANNPLGLIADQYGNSTGITLEQAYGYTKIFNQNDFVCASGFPQFANNEVCGTKVFNTSMPAIQKCDDDFYANMKFSNNDPSLTCTYVSIAKQCVQQIFANACPQVAPLQWWGCQWERTGTQTNFPQCTNIFCTMNEQRQV